MRLKCWSSSAEKLVSFESNVILLLQSNPLNSGLFQKILALLSVRKKKTKVKLCFSTVRNVHFERKRKERGDFGVDKRLIDLLNGHFAVQLKLFLTLFCPNWNTWCQLKFTDQANTIIVKVHCTLTTTKKIKSKKLNHIIIKRNTNLGSCVEYYILNLLKYI